LSRRSPPGAQQVGRVHRIGFLRAGEPLKLWIDEFRAVSGADGLININPAPAVASFSDVPTSHPFFQFIEALARSGITSGCGNGNFCPDAPLSRGQMAVFLSLGLGLHFAP
jgi:S-layer family protein